MSSSCHKHLCLWSFLVLTACSSGDGIVLPPDNRTVYTLDATAGGVMENRNNVVNLSVASRDANDLKATDNRPARRRQFRNLLPGVTDVEGAKTVITYTDPANPLSLFGRWDLGYGETAYPKQIPDGSIDAKAASTGMVKNFMDLSGDLNLAASSSGFWMRYGTPSINGAPFIWSRSSWNWQKLRDVPDRLDGAFTLIPLYLR